MADGAISYYIDHFVQTRVSKLTYGTKTRIYYDPNNPEHRKRSPVTSASGEKRIDGVFWVMLPGVSYLLVSTLKEKNIENIKPLLYVRTSKYPKRMKFVTVNIGILQIMQDYHLPLHLSTAFEV